MKKSGFAAPLILSIVLIVALAAGSLLVWQRDQNAPAQSSPTPSSAPTSTSQIIPSTSLVNPTVTPTPELTPVKEADLNTNALLLKGNLRVLRIGRRYFQEALYPTYISGEIENIKVSDLTPLYHVQEFDVPKSRTHSDLYFDIDPEANYLVITYEHPDNRNNIGTIVMKRSGVSFKVIKDLPLSYPAFNSMFPRVDDVSNGQALIRLSNCLYCEPTVIKSIQLKLDSL